MKIKNFLVKCICKFNHFLDDYDILDGLIFVVLNALLGLFLEVFCGC